MIKSSVEPKEKSTRIRSAHQDTFCADSLPPPDLWPRMQCFGIPEFTYPARMNCAVELLDKMVLNGQGERVAVRSYDGDWTYQHLLENANRIGQVLVEDLGLIP